MNALHSIFLILFIFSIIIVATGVTTGTMNKNNLF